MFNLFSLRNHYYKNGTQWMGRWVNRAIGNNTLFDIAL